MKIAALFLFFALLYLPSPAQRKAPTPAGSSRTADARPSKAKRQAAKPKPSPTPSDASVPEPAPTDKDVLDAALAVTDTSGRVAALEKFLADFPGSELAFSAREYLSISRAVLAEEKIQAADLVAGAASFRRAAEEAPEPVSDRLFDGALIKIPAALFAIQRHAEAIEVAGILAQKAGDNPKRLLSIAAFHLGIENGAAAAELAERAALLAPESVDPLLVLGMARRVNFEIKAAAEAYSKALEIDPNSLAARRALADIRRALGDPEAALGLYQAILADNPGDAAAEAGIVLSLFDASIADAGKREEAEKELERVAGRNTNDYILRAGAAYWYAAHGESAKAIEFAEEAIEIERRYIWAHIALARGYMLQEKPVEAERVLVAARQYGDFPTLEYEIAAARLAAGFFRDAAEGLQKNFSFRDGEITTRLGGRQERTGKDFASLIAAERQASIFAPRGAGKAEEDERLRSLIEFITALEGTAAEKPGAPRTEGNVSGNEFAPGIAEKAERFVSGTDPMRIHRQIFAASALLEKRVAPEKALELAETATDNTNTGLAVGNPAAAVLASELYNGRSLAFARNEYLLVPNIPQQTLSAIIRGRIEELIGWANLQMGRAPDAVIRLRRAISVLPEKSAWWRSTKWRLGEALAAEGKENEALEAFIEAYDKANPDLAKYIAAEALYKKLKGGTEGLEELIGPSPLASLPSQNENAGQAAVSNEAQILSENLPETAKKEDPETSLDETKDNATTTQAAAKTDSGMQGAAASEKESAKAELAEKELVAVDEAKPTDLLKPSGELLEKAVETPKASEEAEEVGTEMTQIEKTASSNATSSNLAVEKSGEALLSMVSPPPHAPQNETIHESDEKGMIIERRSEAETALNQMNKTADGNERSETEKAANDQAARPAPIFEPIIIRIPGFASGSRQRQEKKSDSAIEPPSELPANDPSAAAMPESLHAGSNEKLTLPENSAGVTENLPESLKKSGGSHFGNFGAPDEISGIPTGIPTGNPTGSAHDAPLKETVNLPGEEIEEIAKASKAEIPLQNASTPEVQDEAQDEAQNAAQIPAGSNSEAAEPTTDPETKSPTELIATRPRIIEGKDIRIDLPQCSIKSSQERISLINNGGTIGMLITLDNPQSEVKAISTSPEDIELTPDPEIAGKNGQFLFIVRSISERTGIYTIIFETLCGKKEIPVTVR